MSRNFRTKIFTSVICLLLIFSFSVASASSSEWIPLLPDTINNLEKKGEPETVDVEKMGKTLTVVKQDYGNQNIHLNIFNGSLIPHLQKFEDMTKLTMENEKKIIKQTKVSGYKAGCEIYKNKNHGSLLIKLSDTRVVVIQSEKVKNADELMSLADDVPISEIANRD
ncbi:MAG: hypothetical protein V5A74_06200 [Desulfohalobiaceae bacterium]